MDDELLRAVGLEGRIVEKIKHAGLDDRGMPCCDVWKLEQCEDFKRNMNVVDKTIKAKRSQVYFLVEISAGVKLH